MGDSSHSIPGWLSAWMDNNQIELWGAADLKAFTTPVDESGQGFPVAVAWGIPMNPRIMASVKDGPNQDYADQYTSVNARINRLAGALAEEIQSQGFRAQALAASVRSDPVNVKGDFPHKTAATRAGLGWVGRNCQLVTRGYGPWVRLGTVFTDLELPCGPPVEKSLCGKCTVCVAACPAGALQGRAWHPGIERNKLLDARACDRWKKENYFQYHKGHNCGICSAVCPHGLKRLRK